MFRCRRLISSATSIVLVSVFLLPDPAGAATPILGPSQTDVQTAQLWAQQRNATREFIDIAPLYWLAGPARGGVRPEIAYAQAALETGYGRFGGRVDASFHNPCGLKTATADGDGPDDHKRFASWSEGVTACVDHLALYAGAPGYPRPDTPDERHWSFLFGRARTVEDLGGKWAPSPDYGYKVLNLVNQMLAGTSWDPGIPVTAEFNAYDLAFRGGVSVAGGNVDGLAGDEIVTGAGPGGGPHIRVLRLAGTAVADVGGFFAFSSTFRGGVDVAVGDVDNDGIDELVAGAGPGGSPHVTVRKRTGVGFAEIAGFYAYKTDFRGGVWVGAGNFDGAPGDEVVTGPGLGGGPHVVVWKYRSGGFVPIGGFYAYAPTFAGGVTVGASDVDGDGTDEILTGAGRGGGPHVVAYRLSGGAAASFFAYGSAFTGGVAVAGHGSKFAAGTITGAPHIWSTDGTPMSSEGPRPSSIDVSAYGFNPFDAYGVRVALADVDPGSPGVEVVISQGEGGRSTVRVLSKSPGGAKS